MKDQFGRTIEYMRVSVTDRCNLRCRYCMPEGIEKCSMSQILTFEEIERICKAAVGLGIRKFKITGGEPLVRLGCADFIGRVKSIPGVEQVTLTTNGMQLESSLNSLLESGLDAVNISIDSLRPGRFEYITGGGRLEAALSSLEAALNAGIKTKVNCLLQKDFNEDEMPDFANMAFEKGIDVRFIEMMPVGYGNTSSGVSNDVILERLYCHYPDLCRDISYHGNGPAVYYSIPGRKGAIGFISAIHGVFCSECNRIRLTSQGVIKPCLCFENGVDLKPALASDDDKQIEKALKEAIWNKPLQHCFNSNVAEVERRAMAQIGG